MAGLGNGKTLAITVKAVVDDLVRPMKAAEGAVTSFAGKTEEMAVTSVRSMEKAEEGVRNLHSAFRSLLEAFIGVEIFKGMFELSEAAEHAEQSLKLAALATKNLTGQTFPVEQAKAWAQALAMSNKGGVGFEPIIAAMQRFAIAGASMAQSQRLVDDAIKFSSLTGASFEEVYNAIAMAMEGNVRGLRRFGVAVTDANGKALSFAQIMANIENLSKGASVTPLTIAMERLGEQFRILKEVAGEALIPMLTGMVSALTRIVQAFAGLNPGVQASIVVLGGVSAIMLALTLMLPSLVNGVILLRDAFIIFSDLLGGKVVASILKMAAAWVVEGATAVAAQLAQLWPVALVVAAIILITAAIVEVTSRWDDFSKAAGTAIDWVGSALQKFFEYCRDNFNELATLFLGVWKILETGDLSGGLKDIQSAVGALKAGWLGVGEAAVHAGQQGLAAIGSWVGSQFTGIEKKVMGLFAPVSGKAPLIPHPDLSNLGHTKVPGAKAGPTPDISAENKELVSEFKGHIKDFLEPFEHTLEQAKETLKSREAALADYLATLPTGKPTTKAEGEHAGALQAGINSSQLVVAAAAANEAKFYDQIIEKEKKYAAELQKTADARKRAADALPSGVNAAGQVTNAAEVRAKNAADALYRSAAALAREMKDTAYAAERTAVGLRMGADEAHRAASAGAFKVGADAAGGRRAEDTSAIDASKSAAITSSLDIDQKIEAIVEQKGVLQRTPARGEQQKEQRPIDLAQLDVQIAQLVDQQARDAESLAEHTAHIRADTAAATGAEEDKKAAVAAAQAAMQARLAREKADVGIADADAALTSAIQDRITPLTQALDSLIQKLNVPGLSQQKGGGFSLDPMALLAAAFAKTTEYANIQRTVNEILNMFAQLLQSLLPIINLLMTIVRAIVNVFIDLWNLVARLLALFGIHIALLNQLNSGLVALIAVTHELPTLNELAAGKLSAPLSATPVGLTNPNQSISSQTLDSPALGGGILGAIFAAAVILTIIHAIHALHLAHAVTADALAAAQRTTAQAVMTANFTAQTGTLVAALATGFASVVTAVTTAAFVPSFDVGAWSLPRNTLARVHAGEMIIPAPIADTVRSLLGGAGLTALTAVTSGTNTGSGVPSALGTLLSGAQAGVAGVAAPAGAAAAASAPSASGSSLADVVTAIATQTVALQKAGSGGVQQSTQVNINQPQINGYDDVAQLGQDLAASQMRKLKAGQFSTNRVALGA